MKGQIPIIGNQEDLTPDIIEKIRSLAAMAGGVRFIAKEVNENYDTFHNVLRGKSSDFIALNKMVDKAKAIVKEKVKQLA